MECCVLVVRPQAQAAALLAQCQQNGWHAEWFASMDIRFLPQDKEHVQQRINASNAAFWVSANAVLAAHRLGIVPPLCNVCVGRATLRCFQHCFPQAAAIAPSDGLDSEAVLRLDLWQDSSIRHITVLNGLGGRDWLPKQLSALGKSVQTLPLYERSRHSLDWERFRRLNRHYRCVVCVYSAESVRNLFEQVPPDLREELQSLLYFTIHPRIADELHAYGVGRVLVGEDGQQSVLKLLGQHLVSS